MWLEEAVCRLTAAAMDDVIVRTALMSSIAIHRRYIPTSQHRGITCQPRGISHTPPRNDRGSLRHTSSSSTTVSSCCLPLTDSANVVLPLRVQ